MSATVPTQSPFVTVPDKMEFDTFSDAITKRVDDLTARILKLEMPIVVLPPPPPPPPIVVTAPLTVNDLTVASVTPNTITLAFTEVDDGSGKPASYEIRYAAGTLSWSTGTAIPSLVGTTIGAKRTIVVTGLVPVTSYQFQLVSYRGVLNVSAMFGGLSNVVSATTTMLGPPPVLSSEPKVLPGDIIAYIDSFESYVDTASLLAAYVNKQSHGTIILNTTQFTGRKVVEFHYNYDGCLGAYDAAILLERPIVGVSWTGREWFVSFEAAFQPGYKFWWSAGGCSRGNASKELIIFRDGNNVTGGRISLLANVESANPPIYGALGSLGWNVTIDMQTGSVKPGFSQIIKQHLALGIKDPNAIADGLLHRFTMHYVKESGIDVGDGIIQLWIDGILVIDYNGADLASASYHQTWTRTNDFGSPIQFPSVLNGGAPQAQSQWWDNIVIWHRP